MIFKTIIKYHQCHKSYIVSYFTHDTFLAEQTEDTDKAATQTPSKDNEHLIEETQLQDKRYEVTEKGITETCDIDAKFKLFGEFQVYVEKKLLKLEATIVSGCNGQTPAQNNISGNSLTSVSVINMLINRIFFLEIELSKKDVIINHLSSELVTSERSKSQDSTNSSRCYALICNSCPIL